MGIGGINGKLEENGTRGERGGWVVLGKEEEV